MHLNGSMHYTSKRNWLNVLRPWEQKQNNARGLKLALTHTYTCMHSQKNRKSEFRSLESPDR
uniref:Uncharacterized protein n=1 Tax=Arundo donax TaxID=35708 RepID=A0A0A8YPV7_ARUDO